MAYEVAITPKGPGISNPKGELEGLYSARRGGLHVINEIDEEDGVVAIHRAQHRRVAYRRR